MNLKRPGNNADIEAWKRHADYLQQRCNALESWSGFLHRQLNRIVDSTAWRGLRGARGIMARVLPSLAARSPEDMETERLALEKFEKQHPVPEEKPISAASISIVIPFRDHPDLLKRCLNSIQKHTPAVSYNLVLIDNGSTDGKVNEIIDRARESSELAYLRIDEPFNFSKLNNAAMAMCSNFVLFLNNDTEIISPGWLDAMLEYARNPSVGAVGTKLVYPDGKLQHIGVTLGINGIARNAMSGAADDDSTPLAQRVRCCPAVTAACMMTRKEVFLELGGFNETDFAIAYNDVDYCLRLREKGLSIVYTPHAKLKHHESASRPRIDSPEEALAFCKRWPEEVNQCGNPKT